jgi:hypothetical protein
VDGQYIASVAVTDENRDAVRDSHTHGDSSRARASEHGVRLRALGAGCKRHSGSVDLTDLMNVAHANAAGNVELPFVARRKRVPKPVTAEQL